jgi:mannose-6-phosphate isomerase-like protein (cupin superfamily)
MRGFVTNIERDTLDNENFRKVIFTTKLSQLVLMTLLPNQDIGEEVHTVDQFFRVESGNGKVFIDGVENNISDGSAIVVPAGSKHNIINTSSDEKLRLYTIYTPPNHPDGTIHENKEQALADEHDHL